MKSIKILFKSIFLIFLFLSSHAFSEILNKIEISGNDRISDETIKLFISIEVNEQINDKN
jgi:outer membrane protein assembly factor BamA